MLIISGLYLGLVYLIFFKLKLLPWNKLSQGIATVLGIIILTVFLVGLQTLTPSSVQAVIVGPVTEIAPQVQGEVIEVPVGLNQRVEPGDVLFQIDPRPFQYEVNRLKAQLVETESYVAQLKEVYDAARAATRGTQKQLALSQLRLRQNERLVSTGAGSRFELERYQTEVATLEEQLAANRAQESQARLNLDAHVGDDQARLAQVLAQLERAQFNLDSTTVTAPAEGFVTISSLRPGMVVTPSRSVMAFVYADIVGLGALFSQKALENIRLGNNAKISFPALPGRLFEGEVIQIPYATGEGQFTATGQLPRMTTDRMGRLYPVFISLPEDFPPEHVRLGLAADVFIHTDGAGVVGIVAIVLQWTKTALDYVV